MGRNGASCSTESLTGPIVGNVFGECHAYITLKTSFVDFGKEQVHSSHYKRLHISSLHNTPYFFKSSQKSLTRLTHPFIHFFLLYIYILTENNNFLCIFSFTVFIVNEYFTTVKNLKICAHHLLLTTIHSILKCVTLYQVTIIPSYLYSQMRELKIFKDC